MKVPLIPSLKSFPRRFAYARRAYRGPGEPSEPPVPIDHGTLKGLGDDDHSFYFRADGSRSMAGAIDMASFLINNLLDPAAAQDAATKAYVDSTSADYVIESGASEPASPSNYQLFYNTTDSKVKFYDGSNWLVVLKLDTNENALIAGRYLKE